MVYLSSFLPLALLASSTALAHAAPPNPDKLYVHQKSAESVAATADSPSSTTGARGAHGAKHPRVHDVEDVVKRHLEGQQGMKYQHHRRALGMQRRPASERRSPGVPLGGRKEDVREREKRGGPTTRKDRRGVVDSSQAADDEDDVEESDLQGRAATQYYLASEAAGSTAAVGSAQATVSHSSAAASSSAVSSSSSSSKSSGSSLDGMWKGVSSYYLFALADADRLAVLDAIKAGGFKVVRIFVASVLQNNKGSNNAHVNDLEPNQVGTYDDTILTLIDQLMVECQARGLKLNIALSDRYALGFWSTDSYAVKLNIVAAGSSGAQKVANAASFYTSGSAIGWFENRLKHIMSHKNQQLGKTWAELDDVIYAVEPQNEPQGHMQMASSTWACDRAAYLKSLLPSGSGIKISSGGGITTTDSLGSWAVNCDSFDVISVHDYGTSAQTTANTLASAQAAHPDKVIMMGEWGMTGANKAALISQFVSAFNAKSIPWSYWEVIKPGKAASDFEVWTDEPAWQALTGAQYYTPVAVTTTPANAAATKSSAAAANPHQSGQATTSAQWVKATTSSFVQRVSSAAAAGADKATAAAGAATSAAGAAAEKATSAAAAGGEAVRQSWKSATA
ncbi:hypothetical protein JCM8097_003140 [Rhodosporidiobolus ruineniae]